MGDSSTQLVDKVSSFGTKTKKTVDWIYLIALFVFVAYYACSLTKSTPPFLDILYTVSTFAMMLVAVYRIIVGKSKYLSSTFFAVLFVLAGILMFITYFLSISQGGINLTLIVFALIGAMGVKADKVLLSGICGNLVMIINNVVSTALSDQSSLFNDFQDRRYSIFGNNVFYVSKYNNFSSTDLGAHYFWIFAAYLWVRGKKITWGEILALFGLNCLVYALCASNTTLLCICILLVFAVILKLWTKINTKSDNLANNKIIIFLQKLLGYCSKFSFIIFAAIGIILALSYDIADPTFNADGTIRRLGNFVVKADGPVSYVTPTDAPSENDLVPSLTEAIAAREARYDKIGEDATITWYGEMDLLNKICLGDLQKSATRVLGVALLSQDMEGVMAAIGEEYTAGSYSENNDAPLATGYTPVEKGEVFNTVGIVADTVTIDTAEVQGTQINVQYIGDEDITTARLYVDSALPIKEIVSDNEFEYNPADGRIVVYKSDGTAVDRDLFTIVYEFDGLVADGVYPVDMTIIEVSDMNATLIDAIAIDGAIIADNTYAKGDVTQDGAVNNADLIMIARYLVGLVEFNDKQKESADYNDDGVIDNIDLVLIARAIVASV